MSLPAGTRFGPYEVQALLGAGGMGEVYRAKDSRLDRIVAIKILPPHVVDHPIRRQRFEREARAASRLSHPHICALYDIGEQDGVHFIVMEYLAGESLADRLKGGALPINEALRHATEVADALDHAHRQGIVHRDLKPANIMLTRSGAKLLDFGVARFQRSEPTDSVATRSDSLTEAGTILGTVQYMAPEQLEGKEADARTDIFALGAVTYEMATGRPPFEGASTASLIAAILDRDPPPLTAVRRQSGAEQASAAGLIPPLLEHVVSRCLAKDPEERWQTAGDVRQELKWIAQGSTQLRAASSDAPRRGWATRLGWAAVALVLAMTGAVYVARQFDWLGRQPQGASTFKQLTFRRGNITQARFAPDGQTILYSAAWDGGPVQLFETRSNGPASRALGPRSAGLESVSSSNELALLLGCKLDAGACTGTLARMPLSGGSPREVLEDVIDADWTPDGRELAAIHVAEGESRLEFPIGKRLYATTGKLQFIAFSPKGDRLAFIEHPILSEEAGDLKVIDLEGRAITLSAGWKTIRGLHWSPTGDAVWFTGSQKGKTCSLYAMPLSGALRLVLHAPGDMTLWDISRDGRLLISHGSPRARMIWSNAEIERDLSWLDWSTVADLSIDGKTLLFHEWGVGVDASPVVYTREITGADAVRLGDGKALALSPDGRWALALLEAARPQLVLLPTGTGTSRPLPMGSLSDVYWAKWFPDGHRLLVVSSGADSIPRSYVQDIETGALKQFADAGALAVLVSPDGQRVLVRDPLGGYDLWPIAGGEPVRLEGILQGDLPIQWSRDGQLLYLRAEAQDALRVYRYHVATRRRELWRELAPRDPTGVVGIATGRGEVAVTPDGKNVAFTYWVLLEDLFLVEGVPH